MKRFSAALILGLALGASTAMAAVDPALLGLVVPGAQVITGLQVSQSQASPFGVYVLSQMKPGADLDKLSTAIGFDPRRDLQEIVASSADAQSGLILGRGSFQLSKIATAAVLAGAPTSTYKGFEILGASTGGGKSGGLVFLDSSTVAIGDTSSLQAVIDRRIAGTVFSGPMAQKAVEISAANDAWFATATPSAFLAGKIPTGNGAGFNPVNLLQSVLQTSGGVKFTAAGATVNIEAVANTTQDAQALADVLKFLTSMVQMNRNSSEQAGKAASILDAAAVTVSGSAMRLTMALPEQQLEQLLMPNPASGKSLAGRHPVNGGPVNGATGDVRRRPNPQDR